MDTQQQMMMQQQMAAAEESASPAGQAQQLGGMPAGQVEQLGGGMPSGFQVQQLDPSPAQTADCYAKVRAPLSMTLD